MRIRTAVLVSALLSLLVVYGCGGGGGGASSVAPVGSAPGGGSGGTILGQVTGGSGLNQARLATTKAQGGFGGFRVQLDDSDRFADVDPSTGTFRFDNVEAGFHNLYVRSTSGANRFGVGSATVEPDRPTTIVGPITPQPAGRLTGIVYGVREGAEAERLAGAELDAFPLEAESDTLAALANGRPVLSARTNRDGIYDFPSLASGMYLIHARRRGYIEATHILPVATSGTTTADFALEAEPTNVGNVRGLVSTLLRGQTVPLRDAIVVLYSQQTPPPHEPGQGPEAPPPPPEGLDVRTINNALPPVAGAANIPGLRGPQHPQAIRRMHPIGLFYRPLFASTNADGTFEINGVPAGRYQAIVMKEGFTRETRGIEVRANETFELNAVLRYNIGRLTGMVTHSITGRLIAHAGVIAFSNDPGFGFGAGGAETESRAGGANGGMTLARRRQAPGATGAAGLAHFPPLQQFAETNAQGRYEMNVEAGPQVVIVFAEGFWDAFQETTVPVGGTAQVNFQLTPAPLNDDPVEILPLGRVFGPHLSRTR